jgi:hypothetical protein
MPRQKSADRLLYEPRFVEYERPQRIGVATTLPFANE